MRSVEPENQVNLRTNLMQKSNIESPFRAKNTFLKYQDNSDSGRELTDNSPIKETEIA